MFKSIKPKERMNPKTLDEWGAVSVTVSSIYKALMKEFSA